MDLPTIKREFSVDLSTIKREFFAFRNGIVADTLRRAGDPHKTIFGLNVPQLAEMARRLVPDMELARALWADDDVRESRLLACYLFPAAEVDMETAVGLAAQVRTQEEADMLAFRLLKRLDYAGDLLERLRAAECTVRVADSLARHLG